MYETKVPMRTLERSVSGLLRVKMTTNDASRKQLTFSCCLPPSLTLSQTDQLYYVYVRDYINKSMKLDLVNLKKRKLLHGITDDMGLHASKQKYCETDVNSECETSTITAMDTEHVDTWLDSESDISVLDTQVESTQGSNSFLGDAQSENVDVKVDTCFGNTSPYDEASTNWDNSRSASSRNGTGYAESSTVRNSHDHEDEEQCLNQDARWHDIDGFDECISTPYFEDNGGQPIKVIHDFLSASGVDPNIFTLPPDETEPGTSKPTIDQEFEQYFSTLML